MAAGFGTGFPFGEALTPSDYETLRLLVSSYGTRLLMDVLQDMENVANQDFSSSWAGNDTKPLQAQGCAGFSTSLPLSMPSFMDIDSTGGGFPESGRSDTSSPYMQSHYAPSSAASPPQLDLSEPLVPVPMTTNWAPSSWPGLSLAPFPSPLLKALPEKKKLPALPPRSVPLSTSSSPLVLPDGTKKAIECPLCSVHGISVGFGRKSDLKKHLYRFHGHDHLWMCSAAGCGRAFDLEKAYAAHMKADHDVCLAAGDASLGMALVPLPPRSVFACGFEGCKAVFEGPASGTGDAGSSAMVLERFFDHVTGHFGKSRPSSAVAAAEAAAEWGFSTQMHNLLRQAAVKEAWKGYGDKAARAQLRWRAGASGLLKATLETGQFRDVDEVLRAALREGEIPQR